MRHTGGGGRAGSEFASEAGEAATKHGDDVARGLEETGKGKEAVEELLDGDGVFKNSELEERYQRYLKDKQKRNLEPRDRLDWKEASDYWANESPMARGNRFNETVRNSDLYDYHEVHLGSGKRLDSYDPDFGEIISRKATDLDKIQEETFRGYLQEIRDKYSVGETIRSNAYPELDGLKLDFGNSC
ncbi:hypothetical protein [Streptococcus sp. DD13]|uniref:hypothetical protein n=1 Tax=Streptococcus sp. DD13 TaxID=1777881 RepID=UPI0007950B47|nr:hypothetical protein [Streptococcus sp. DD13]KXT78150.1 hypothetical protein STRDD13_00975 [Streptococcus sp. DD13]